MYESYEKFRVSDMGLSIRRMVKTVILTAASVFVLYTLAAATIGHGVRIQSGSMVPNLLPGDIVLVSTLEYGPKVPLLGVVLPGIASPQRGDLAVINLPRNSPFSQALDHAADFFTLNFFDFFSDASGHPSGSNLVRRIVGLPGDTVKIEEYRAFIKQKDDVAFKAEEELAKTMYRINSIPARQVSRDFQRAYPFSGNMESVILGPGEYFVLSDDRGFLDDSRTFGPIRQEFLHARIVGRIWPVDRFGTP